MNQFSKMARRMAVVLGLVAASSGAWAQSSATGTANATATVVRPIAVTAPVDLAFGNVVPSSSAGTLTLTAAASTVATAALGATQPGTQAGTVTAARFDVTGEAAFTYSIVLPAGASTINGPSSATMTVDTFTSNIASGTLSGLGAQSFYVGGKLHVGANQAAGSYTGTFDVIVAYN
jgi:spore coat protein U-like protein